MAKRFQFRLETVERIRRRELDATRRVVGAAAREAQAVQVDLDQSVHELNDTVEVCRALQVHGVLDVVAIRQHVFFRGQVHRDIHAGSLKLARAQAKVEEHRGELVVASKRLKVIEKLHLRHWARHRKDLQRMERMATDEGALNLFLRQRSTSEEADKR